MYISNVMHKMGGTGTFSCNRFFIYLTIIPMIT